MIEASSDYTTLAGQVLRAMWVMRLVKETFAVISHCTVSLKAQSVTHVLKHTSPLCSLIAMMESYSVPFDVRFDAMFSLVADGRGEGVVTGVVSSQTGTCKAYCE